MPSFEGSMFRKQETNLDLDLHELERIYLFQETTPGFIQHRTEELKRQYPNESHARIEFFNASKEYERARALHEDYLTYAAEEYVGKRSIADVDPESFYRHANSFPEMNELVVTEEYAMDAYAKAHTSFWKGEYVDAYDAKAYQLDLEAEAAQRIPNGSLRKHAIERTEERMLYEVIPMVDNPGKKFEYIFITFVRGLIRKAGMEHVIDIHHGLPIEDMVDKTDVVLLFGNSAYELQLKAFSSDAYRREYHENLIEKTKEKLSDKPVKLLTIDPDMLRDCYEALCEKTPSPSQKRKLTASGKQIISMLADLMEPEDGKQFREVFEERDTKSKEKVEGKKLSDKFIQANRPPDLLIALGFLSAEDRNNIPKILDAKKRMDAYIPQIKQIFGTEASYMQLDPEAIKKFEQITGGVSARTK